MSGNMMQKGTELNVCVRVGVGGEHTSIEIKLMCISPPYPPIAHSVQKNVFLNDNVSHCVPQFHFLCYFLSISSLFTPVHMPLISLFLYLNAPSIQTQSEGGCCLATSFYKDNSKILNLSFPLPP